MLYNQSFIQDMQYKVDYPLAPQYIFNSLIIDNDMNEQYSDGQLMLEENNEEQNILKMPENDELEYGKVRNNHKCIENYHINEDMEYRIDIKYDTVDKRQIIQPYKSNEQFGHNESAQLSIKQSQDYKIDQSEVSSESEHSDISTFQLEGTQNDQQYQSIYSFYGMEQNIQLSDFSQCKQQSTINLGGEVSNRIQWENHQVQEQMARIRNRRRPYYTLFVQSQSSQNNRSQYTNLPFTNECNSIDPDSFDIFHQSQKEKYICAGEYYQNQVGDSYAL